MAGTCECGNEALVYIKCGEFLDYLKNLLAFQEGICTMALVSKHEILQRLSLTLIGPGSTIS